MLVLMSLQTDMRESSLAWTEDLTLSAETMVLKEGKILGLTQLLLMLEINLEQEMLNGQAVVHMEQPVHMEQVLLT